MLKQQNKQQAEVIHDLDKNNYRGECETLRLENKELKKKLKIYEEKFELARISLGKNSSNSLKPSSTNGFKKVVQNNRVKSGRKPGREKGHVRSAPTVTKTPDKTIIVSKVATCTCGCKTIEKEEIARDLISLEVIVHTTQYVGKKTKCPCCGKEHMSKFPNSVNSIVNYDEGIKALVVYLNTYCNIQNQKTAELLGLISDNKIKMCQGTVCHDHNKIHLSFPQSKQAECNFHILRYCKAEYEVHKREIIKEFMDYLLELRDKVEEYKLQEKTCFTDIEYETAKAKYLELLDILDEEFKKEYDKEKEQYYDSERCLKSRLREYVDDHLRFLTDFRIEFTNNLAERGLRKIKTKLKIAGEFRNLKFAKYYCDAISIIDSSLFF